MTEIVAARFADPNATVIVVEFDDGSTASAPADPMNTHYRRVTDGDVGAGRSPIAISPFRPWSSLLEAKAALVAEIKAEAMRRILAIMPEWRQRNALAHGLSLVRKVQNGETLGPEEQAIEAAYLAAWEDVFAIRALSDQKEAAAGRLADLAAAEAYDVAEGWPA